MDNARQMLDMVVATSNGMLDDEQQRALTAQIVGAFAAVPVVGRNIVFLAQQQNWNGLIGALGSYIDIQGASASSRSVSVTNYAPMTNRSMATSSSTSVSHLSFEKQLERTKVAIEYSDSIPSKDKVATIEALEDAKRAAKAGDHQGLAEHMSKALDMASKGAGVAKAVLDLVPMLVELLPKG